MYKGERSSLTGATLVAAAETNCWRVRAMDKGAGAGKKPWTVTARSKARRRQSVGVVEDGMLMLAGMGHGSGACAPVVCVGVGAGMMSSGMKTNAGKRTRRAKAL